MANVRYGLNVHYVLNDRNEPVPEPDLMKWARWFDNSRITVAREEVAGLTVSTVFLGIDHNFGSGGPPVLFETMTFGDGDDRCQRYETWDEALAGHGRVVEQLRNRPTERRQ